MNNTYEPFDDVKVRQAIAMGIDRQRIVDNFFPPGSTVADHFMPCDIPHGCAGSDVVRVRPRGGEGAPRRSRLPGRLPDEDLSYRDSDRCYVTAQPTIAQEIQAQLKTNLNIDADDRDPGIRRRSSTTMRPGSSTASSMLGWGADYPDATNFLDYHFGAGAGVKFGEPFPDLVDVLNAAGQTPDERSATTLYGQANDLFTEYVPMVPIAHGGSSDVFKADVTGAHSSPLEQRAVRGDEAR